MATQVKAERTHIVEFSESEIKEILGTAVKQMVRIANEPSSDQEIATLGKVIEKCSLISKRKN
jgi:hypothetical protein